MTKTLFLDIDGCVLFHEDNFVKVISGDVEPKALPNVAETLFKWHVTGNLIILTTGRPECMRNATAHALQVEGIIYDQLVMGCGSGERILVNDKGHLGNDKALALSIDRNSDFTDKVLSML